MNISVGQLGDQISDSRKALNAITGICGQWETCISNESTDRKHMPEGLHRQACDGLQFISHNNVALLRVGELFKKYDKDLLKTVKAFADELARLLHAKNLTLEEPFLEWQVISEMDIPSSGTETTIYLGLIQKMGTMAAKYASL